MVNVCVLRMITDFNVYIFKTTLTFHVHANRQTAVSEYCDFEVAIRHKIKPTIYFRHQERFAASHVYQYGFIIRYTISYICGCLDPTVAAKQLKTAQENKPLEARSDSPTGS